MYNYHFLFDFFNLIYKFIFLLYYVLYKIHDFCIFNK